MNEINSNRTINQNDISLCSFNDELFPNLNILNTNIKEYSIKHTKILDSFSLVLLKQMKYKIENENNPNNDSKEMIEYKNNVVLIIKDILTHDPKSKSQLYQFYQNLQNINYYILVFKTFFDIKVKSNIITSHIVFKFTVQISRRSGVVLIENLLVKLYYEINTVLTKTSINLNDNLSKSELLKMTLYNSIIDDLANTKCGCSSQDCYICKEKGFRPFDVFVKQLNKIAHYNDSLKNISILFFSNKLYSASNIGCSFCPELNNFPVFPELPIEKVSKLFYANDLDHHCLFYACEKCYDMISSNDIIRLCPNCSRFYVNLHYIQKFKHDK